jgi:hypothetical protein
MKFFQWESCRSIRTDGYDEAKSSFLQFCKRVYKAIENVRGTEVQVLVFLNLAAKGKWESGAVVI